MRLKIFRGPPEKLEREANAWAEDNFVRIHHSTICVIEASARHKQLVMAVWYEQP